MVNSQFWLVSTTTVFEALGRYDFLIFYLLAQNHKVWDAGWGYVEQWVETVPTGPESRLL